MANAASLVPVIYLSLPILSAAASFGYSRRVRRVTAVRDFFSSCTAGAVAGGMLGLLYEQYSHGRVPLSQIAIACYWGAAVACVLRAFNLLLTWGVDRIIPSGPDGRACCPAAEVAAAVLKAAGLLAFSIPYVGSMVLIYRPHIVTPGDPRTLLDADYQAVTFSATDGVRLSGWWIGATHNENSDDSPDAPFGQRTIILCHGFGTDKAADLKMARELAPNGYNVFAFDFRAHGQSGGQFTSFGDLERRDVLGAVRWVRQNHPRECRKIFGLGESLGSAALVAAAADPVEGQSIDAIALFAPYDTLPSYLQDAANGNSIPMAGWLANHWALPVAEWQLGTKLSRFSLDRQIDKIAPRPVLIIASEADAGVHQSLSQQVYDSASQPKYCLWLNKSNRRTMLFSSDRAAIAVRIFFETAKSVL